jgi:hypothetical protein
MREREQKRNKVQQLFEERQRITDEMATLNAQLFQMDEEIDQLEQQQLHQYDNYTNVKQESNTTSGSEPAASTQASSSGQLSMTMNPDEILTGPATQKAAEDDREQDNRELLTDPLTWTQTQNQTESHALEERPSSASSGRVPLRPLDLRPVERNPPAKRKNDTSTATPMGGYPVSSNADDNSSNYWDEGEDDTGNSALVVGSAIAVAAPPRRVTLGTASPFFQSTDRNDPNCPFSTHDISQTLRQTFRLQNFRENQLEIIQTTLSGKDCFVLMKTGGGKSLVRTLGYVRMS